MCVAGSEMWIFYEVQTKKNEQKSIEASYIRLQLQFIIHFLPVSSGFHRDTRTFCSLLSMKGTFSTNAQLSSAISRMTLGASVVC